MFCAREGRVRERPVLVVVVCAECGRFEGCRTRVPGMWTA